MAIVQSFGSLQSLTTPMPSWTYQGSSRGAIDLYGGSLQSYAAIYRTQPNVRTVVDFLARNVAQLGLHVFRRVDDTDRVRLPNHQLAQWIGKPNPATTRYRLIETLMQDLAIYFNAYWLKVRQPDAIGLLRLPPEFIHVEGSLLPTTFVWTGIDGRRVEFAPSEVVHFSGFDPRNPLMGVSPLETLRRVIAEEQAAGDYRENFWLNAGRFEGVIERPAAAKAWTPTQKTSFREQWQGAFGANGTQVGAVAVLEDGMIFKPASWSAKDSEFLGARKLAREECAAAYHIPLPMVGILDHATFSNIREQHKNLYQDCLGPWLVMIEEEIERQLLPDCVDNADVYVEFNIAEKLKGSFEEQAASLLAMTGRPVMTGNEGRARLNLPRITDDPSMDKVAAQQGGPSALAPSEPVAVAEVITTTKQRQFARLERVPVADRPAAFVATRDRWARELALDLLPLVGLARAQQLALDVNAETLITLRAAAPEAA